MTDEHRNAFPRRRHWSAVALIVLLGTALFVVAAWEAWPSPATRALSEAIGEARKDYVWVVCAAYDLPAGRAIQGEDLSWVQIPADYLTAGVVRDVDDVVGRVPAARILAYEFIREERLRGNP